MSGFTLDRRTLDAAAFSLGQAAPDPEPLIVLERVVKALGTDLTAAADPLRLPGRTALLRKERFRIRLRAQRLVLPAYVIDVFRTDDDMR